MKIEYRPKGSEQESRPIVDAFFELYELKGTSGIRVDPSIDNSTPGIMISPIQGSVIEQICAKDVVRVGKLIKSGNSYVTLDITHGQRCLVNFDFQESCMKP